MTTKNETKKHSTNKESPVPESRLALKKQKTKNKSSKELYQKITKWNFKFAARGTTLKQHQEIIGKLLNQFIFCYISDMLTQVTIMETPCGIRVAQTFRKLPIIEPRTKPMDVLR